MRIEHFAYIVAEPAKVAAWYVQQFGWRVCRSQEQSPFAHFIADSSGNVMVEIYNNPAAKVPDYRSMDPLVMHIGLECADVNGIRQKLMSAGATDAGGIIVTPAGDRLAMLRDPWGMAIQLCCRKKPIC